MAAELQLRLMGTSDLHANIHPYDYYRDRPDDTVGLAKTASLIAAARREAPNSLLFDNGDVIQGTPLGDYAARRSPRGQTRFSSCSRRSCVISLLPTACVAGGDPAGS